MMRSVSRIFLIGAFVYALLALALPGLADDTPRGACCSSSICASQHHHGEEPKPAGKLKLHFDYGRLAQAHWAATAFDSASTGTFVAACRTCYEADPIARATLGRRPRAWRLAMDWAGESAAVSLIANRRWRRVVQVVLIGVHLECGVHNFARWH